jgi:hypothetical protein
VLEAHPTNAINIMQSVVMNAEEALEKGFTSFPRQE